MASAGAPGEKSPLTVKGESSPLGWGGGMCLWTVPAPPPTTPPQAQQTQAKWGFSSLRFHLRASGLWVAVQGILSSHPGAPEEDSLSPTAPAARPSVWAP